MPMPDVIQHASAQCSKFVGDVSVGGNCQNDESVQGKKERDSLVNEGNAHRMKKEKRGLTQMEREVAMEAMTRSVADLERKVSRLETETSLLIKRVKRFFPTLLRTVRSGGRTMEKLRKYILSVYLAFAFGVQKETRMLCRREVSEIVPCLAELRKRCNLRSRVVEEAGNRREDRTLFSPSIQNLEFELHTAYMALIVSADQRL